MNSRYISIWFPFLKTDWYTRKHPELKELAFVLVAAKQGRRIVTAANEFAVRTGIENGMALADALAVFPGILHFDDNQEQVPQLLTHLAEWLIRFSPIVAVDMPDGLVLDASGCAHLWKGELPYLDEISNRLMQFGYQVKLSMADTIGTAWAVARFADHPGIVEPGSHMEALLPLPPVALRLDAITIDRFVKLGLRQCSQFVSLPRIALRRRFGLSFLLRLDQAVGFESETVQPVVPVVAYQERLPCLEPILYLTGIEIALTRLLDSLCLRLRQEQKGLRKAVFKCYRVDGKMELIEIGTNRASCNCQHLFRLLSLKMENIEPAGGIELFLLEAPVVEPLQVIQEKLFTSSVELNDHVLAELIDRLEAKIGSQQISRYFPAQHYWPERSYARVTELAASMSNPWKLERPRPIQLLKEPDPIEVTAPVPDYPPMLFRYKNQIHKIIKADGPERIEQEWWLQEGQHRDYYVVEDEEGQRYWLFRSGHYDVPKTYQWFIHGFFA